MSLNRVVLSGNLTADPNISASGSGMYISRFTVAVNEYRKQEKQTHFFECTAFGKTAEFMQNYIKKGNKVLLEGRLNLQRWEKDGEKRSKVVVLVERLESCGSNSGKTGGFSKPPQDQAKQGSDSYPEDFDDDIDYMGDQSDLPF